MLFVDADAISKMAHWHMLPILPALTGFDFDRMATLSSLKHRAYRSITKPDGKLFVSVEAAKAAYDAICNMKDLPDPDETHLEPFASSPQINSGEAILMAQVLATGGSVLATGDKRSVRALSELPVAISFTGRIMILEQIVRACLAGQGRAWLLTHVCPHRDRDTAIRNCLGSDCNAAESSIKAGLESYISEISKLGPCCLLCP